MIPRPMDDPRDKLQRADRWELVAYARANNVDLPYGEETPKIVSEQILRGRGLISPPIKDVPLGGTPILGSAPQGPAIDANADFMRQYEQQMKNPPPPPEKIEKSSVGNKINDLRAQCKARGIPLSRKDNIETLKAKLDGQAAA